MMQYSSLNAQPKTKFFFIIIFYFIIETIILKIAMMSAAKAILSLRVQGVFSASFIFFTFRPFSVSLILLSSRFSINPKAFTCLKYLSSFFYQLLIIHCGYSSSFFLGFLQDFITEIF